MSTFLRRSSVAVAAALLAGACTVHKSETPTLTGPSEFGLSVNVSAIPDSINQDGASQSAIVASVHDASGQPKAGVSLRADIGSGYGQLSANTMVTGADGKASTVYTAPAAAPGAGPTSVSIVVTPIGTDYQAAVPHAVSIRLSPPGVVVPVIGAPLPRFVVTPAAPNANSPATLDGTSSCGSTDAGGACTLSSLVVKWAWDFGDGTTGSGPVVTHAFPLQQTYSVTLTVTNDKGVSMFRSQSVVVGPGLLPTASFTFSPAAPGVGDTVYFNAAASTPGAGHTIASYQWSSGDGNVGTGMTPTYKFLKQGSFTVTLVVVDEAGQKSPPATQVIAVGAGTPKPTAEFTSPSRGRPLPTTPGTSATTHRSSRPTAGSRHTSSRGQRPSWSISW
ncbi:MAG: PKD domain-containing protein [Acidobacteriia bacterium]|nr:PKD domain-containing protein [Terriglobia bacterium]